MGMEDLVVSEECDEGHWVESKDVVEFCKWLSEECQ